MTYGLGESGDDYPQRRTRGKKINYVENLGTDSDDVSDEDMITRSFYPPRVPIGEIFLLISGQREIQENTER